MMNSAITKFFFLKVLLLIFLILGNGTCYRNFWSDVPPNTVFENHAHHRFHTKQIIETNVKRGVYEIDDYTKGCIPRHGMMQYGTMRYGFV